MRDSRCSSAALRPHAGSSRSGSILWELCPPGHLGVRGYCPLWWQHSLPVALNMAKEMFGLPPGVFMCCLLKGDLCPELSMILALGALRSLLRK